MEDKHLISIIRRISSSPLAPDTHSWYDKEGHEHIIPTQGLYAKVHRILFTLGVLLSGTKRFPISVEDALWWVNKDDPHSIKKYQDGISQAPEYLLGQDYIIIYNEILKEEDGNNKGDPEEVEDEEYEADDEMDENITRRTVMLSYMGFIKFCLSVLGCYNKTIAQVILSSGNESCRQIPLNF